MFAAYFTVQASLATLLAYRKRNWPAVAGFSGIGLMMLIVLIFGLPLERDTGSLRRTDGRHPGPAADPTDPPSVPRSLLTRRIADAAMSVSRFEMPYGVGGEQLEGSWTAK